LAGFADRLIELSRNLKVLQKLLHDAAGAQVFAVSILTAMALEETRDLAKVCQTIGIYVPAIFLNLATPAGDCAFCSALRRQEERIRQQFRQVFPDKELPLIYRQGELRGVTRLLELGHTMYMPTGKASVVYA
jgi:anion-transporting  ArsA/GET3 family ATPase